MKKKCSFEKATCPKCGREVAVNKGSAADYVCPCRVSTPKVKQEAKRENLQ